MSETKPTSEELIQAVRECRERMSTYTPAQRAECERRAYAIMRGEDPYANGYWDYPITDTTRRERDAVDKWTQAREGYKYRSNLNPPPEGYPGITKEEVREPE